MDLHNNIKASRVLSPAAAVTDNTAQVGEIIDNAGFGSLEYIIALGALADADATFAVLLEEGNESDLSDNAAVADADLIGTEAAASFQFDDDDSAKKLGYKGKKRYSRLTITPAANTGNAFIAAVAVQSHPRKAPVS